MKKSAEEIKLEVLAELYPKLAAEVAETLIEKGEDLPREQWLFMVAFMMLLTSLQMTEHAKLGAMTQLKNFVSVSGLDWQAFMTAAAATIRMSDKRLMTPDEVAENTNKRGTK